MNLTSKGLEMDILVDRNTSRSTSIDNYIAIDTPENPKFFWGNHLIFKESPQQDRVPHYIESFKQHFKDLPDVEHTAFTWEDLVSNKIAVYIKPL